MPVWGGDNRVVRKVIRRRIRKQANGVNVAGDIQGVVATNVVGSGATHRQSTNSDVRVVERDGKTEVTESYERDSD